VSLIYGGMILRVSQASMFMEMSNFFINGRFLFYFRQILLYHEMEDGLLGLVNGYICMGTFFVSRIMFQSWAIIKLVGPFCIFSNDYKLIFIGIAYSLLYVLNLIWIFKIHHMM
jgi:hypothetical protein